VILARELGPNIYGVWALVVSVATLVPFLLSMRTQFMMTKSLVNDKDNPDQMAVHFQFLHSTNLLSYTLAGVLILVVGLLSSYIFELSSGYEMLFVIVSATAFFRSLDPTWISITRNEKSFILLAVSQLLHTLPFFLWVLACKVWIGFELTTLAWGYVLGGGIGWTLRFVYVRKTIRSQYGFHLNWFGFLDFFKLKEKAGPMWQEAKPVYLGTMFETLPRNLDNVLLGFFQASSAVAIFRTASVLIRGVGKLVKPLNRVLFQDFARLLKKDREAELRTAIKSYLLFSAPTLLIAFLTLAYFMEEVVLFVYGDAYREAVGSMLFLLPGVYFSFVLFWTKTYAIAKGMTSEFQKSMAWAATVFVLLGSVAASVYGPEGVAAASSGALVFQQCWLAIQIWWAKSDSLRSD
ncbi:MAG: oligosaccharide flippase family protein, partial [Pseudomonadota bacterium]